MNEDLKRFEFKLDRVDQRLNSIDVTLAKTAIILDETTKHYIGLENQIKPIQKHVSMVEGAAKLLALIGILAAILEAFMIVFKK